MAQTKKIAVLLSQGFEETEALATVDVLRRAGFSCDMVSMDAGNGGDAALQVTGSHGITVVADKAFEEMDAYDMVVLPGGLPGAEHLRDDARVIALLRRFDAQGRFIAAICAAPMALKEAESWAAAPSRPIPARALTRCLPGAITGRSWLCATAT